MEIKTKKRLMKLGEVAAICTSIMTIQAFIGLLFLPHAEDYVQKQITQSFDSVAFEKKMFDMADKYVDSPNFKVMIIQMQKEFEKIQEQRFGSLETEWDLLADLIHADREEVVIRIADMYKNYLILHQNE